MSKKSFLRVLLVSILSAGAVSASTLTAGSYFEIQAEAADKVSVSVDKINVKPGEHFTITVKGAPGKEISEASVRFISSDNEESFSIYMWDDDFEGNVGSKLKYLDNSYAYNSGERIYTLSEVDIYYSDGTDESFSSDKELSQIGNLQVNLSPKNNDTEGPKLGKVSLDKTRVKPGEKVNLKFEISDDTDVNSIYYIFKNQSSGYEIAGYQYGNVPRVFTDEITIGNEDRNGVYVLDRVELEDTLVNTKEYKSSEIHNAIGKLSFEVYDSYGDQEGWSIFIAGKGSYEDYHYDYDGSRSDAKQYFIKDNEINALPPGITYDKKLSTITLNNYNGSGIIVSYDYPSGSDKGGFYKDYKNQININLVGNNSVSFLYVSDACVFQGDGSLNIEGSESNDYLDYGIIAPQISVQSGSLNLKRCKATGIGILDLDGGWGPVPYTRWTITGGNVDIDDGAIFTNDIHISNAIVKIKNGELNASYGYNNYEVDNYYEDAGILTMDNAELILEGESEISFSKYEDVSGNHHFFMGKTESEKKEKAFGEVFEKREYDDELIHNSEAAGGYRPAGKFYGYNYFQITSKGYEVTAKEVKLDKSVLSLDKGKTGKLTATVTPADADDKTVTWSSSNTNVATVDASGNVKAINHGTAKITAKTSNGKTATCEVRVSFIDVTNAKEWYYKPVYWAAEKGITTGTDGKFFPADSCTREQAITFLWRMAGKPNPKSMVSKYSDVKDTKRYSYKAIMWGTEKGVITGTDGKFYPTGTCTREQIVTMIWRLAGKPEPKNMNSKFKDVTSKTRYSYKAVMWAAEKGITTGTNGLFYPTGQCKRREIVTFIYRYKN